ncbi:polysaccharide pyruvyl transferase family protein [Fertoebacter nigrum]|uniref:Polysaccharide pyruvyl transferase family protein n=1 Tax=Fertoeibacter niger TaxID=2656921 RepID=A0A8X8GYC0_9RHOB|nr:polysaccharide pyruvyl transferase family protein [Fertoeibacter niger]NUB46524.1 polysaccharide pyruvyl transferase family protein [Fertoeibacter niger]
MKNPYISGLFPYIFDPEEKDSEGLLKLSGRNLGNFMFCSSARRFIRTTTKTDRQSVDLEVVKRECDGIVILAANWLQPRNDFTGLAARIEKANVPTVILGLGAQSHDGKIPDLHPGMLRFLKAVSERCVSLSVRGTFSAEVLEHHGITNVTVTGCPSLLWHMTHSAAVTRQTAPGQIGRISVSGTLPDQVNPKGDDARMRLTRFILKQALEEGYDYVAQTELPLMQAHRGELTDAHTVEHDFLRHVFSPADEAQTQAYLARHIRVFTNIPEWLAYCANQDFVIGTRLHGVIAGLLAGTPSMLITHDTRTEEMAQFAGIPAVRSTDLLAAGRMDMEALLARADFAAFNTRQVAYFRNFIQFLDANAVPHRLGAI